MIVIRNSKEDQRDSARNRSRAYTLPARSSFPGGSQATVSTRPIHGLGDVTRLSREPSAPAFRTDDRLVGPESNDPRGLTTNDIHRHVNQRQFVERSAIPISQPALWSHHQPRNGSPDWHRQVHAATRRLPQQLWPENRSDSSRILVTHVAASLRSRQWGWSHLSNPSRELYGSQREWTTWQTNGSVTRKAFSFGTLPMQNGLLSRESTCQGTKQDHDMGRKRSQSQSLPPSFSLKRSKGHDMLDLLCQATLDVGPMQDNPTGCSCPKSKCVALYCDCFKAGRRCDEKNCGCIDCKNTVAESGIDGARTKAIRSILARNPRAFIMAGISAAEKRAPPGEIACNCIRSRCLKLYCCCFQNNKTCTSSCTCVGCSNTEENDTERQLAVQLCLEKRPDAFQQRVREPGLGCACKNNRCIRKYCECFRSNLACTNKCTCRRCENHTASENDSS